MKDSEIKFIQPPAPEEIEIPDQRDFYSSPARFGAVPMDELPLGWEQETRKRETKITKFQHLYPRITLPFQEVKRVDFGHNAEFLKQNESNPKLKELFPTSANRLFFGDKNEVRSFTDIWEGGMPGYLIWLNARLVEMKHLLKPTGSIYVHLDWHACHYVKVEMDKIFGNDNFVNEIVWWYKRWSNAARNYQRMHDVILFYRKTNQYKFIVQYQAYSQPDAIEDTVRGVIDGKLVRLKDENGDYVKREKDNKGVPCHDVFNIQHVQPTARERIGYPTQKPVKLLERIITGASERGDVVADFFCGGGTTPAVAQCLNRRWIACDQSRIAVAITADRISKIVEEKDIRQMFLVPDFTIEHWGIYEIPQLEVLNEAKFRTFVIQAYGGRPESTSPDIHGLRHGVPLYVGQPSRKTSIGRDDVAKFAKAVFEEKHGHAGTMLAWNFSPEARKAAEILALRENKRIDFVRLSLVRLESSDYREHVISKKKEYEELLSFIQPPQVRIKTRRIERLRYEFDVSESVSLNRDGVIANVQWDFDYKSRFTTTQGYSFLRDKKTETPILVVEYSFPKAGQYNVGCSVQDDQGGERTEIFRLEVS